MRVFTFLLAFFSISFAFGQSFTISGGYRPTNLLGTHFSFKSEIVNYRKITYGIGYSMVKYKDMFRGPRDGRPRLHIEDKGDKTIFDFPELDRGTALQTNDRDFRPKTINHRFSLYAGLNLVDNKNYRIAASVAPHLLIARQTLWYLAYEFAEFTFNEGDEVKIVQYNDYQTYRDWDIGGSVRVDCEYKVLDNIALGVSGQIFSDFALGGIGVIYGVSITLDFNN